MTDPTAEPTHQTMNYMVRFGCIGPQCEENCCQDGWRIDVNPEGYQRLQAATAFAPQEIAKRIRAAIREVPPKRKKEKSRFIIKQDKSGACPLFDDGWCAIHANFGIEMLPHVCAIYPRKLKRIGEMYELSATASCPEVTRQLILHEDGVDVVPLDLDILSRRVLQEGMDPRDLRPFYRALERVRDYIIALFRDESLPLEHRYFLMAWFAKRTSALLQKGRARGDLAPVEREMRLLDDAAARREILSRFEQLETPAALGVMVARSVVRPQTKGLVRPRWNALVSAVIETYSKLAEILPRSGDEADHDRAAAEDSERVSMTVREVWVEYRRRRERLRSHPGAAARLDRYFKNYTIHTWFHRMPTEESSLLAYVLRTLAQQASMKFLVVSHPRVTEALDQVDQAEALADREAADALLGAALDEVAVDVFYQVARHVEHGYIIRWFTEMLEKQGWASLAGAVYLIRF